MKVTNPLGAMAHVDRRSAGHECGATGAKRPVASIQKSVHGLQSG